MERAWYDQDEDANIRNENNFGGFLQSEEKKMEEEAALKRKKKAANPNAYKNVNSAEADKWEINQMIVSGAVKKDDKTEQELYEVEEEERVVLIVRDIKPPFLDGRIVFTT